MIFENIENVDRVYGESIPFVSSHRIDTDCMKVVWVSGVNIFLITIVISETYLWGVVYISQS